MHEAADGKMQCIAHWSLTGQRPRGPSIVNPVEIRTLRQEADSSIDKDEEAIVYTDGACYLNGNKDARAAIGVWFGPSHDLNLSKVLPLTKKQSNNTAEIYAAVEAVRQVRIMGKKKICIRSDCEILVNAWNKMVPYWQINGWRTSAGQPVRHKEEFTTLINEVAQTPGATLRMEHVPGHGDCYGNIGADALASMAIHLYVDRKNAQNQLLDPRAPKEVYHKSIFGGERCHRALPKEKREAIEKSCQLIKEKLEKQEKEDELKKFSNEVSDDYLKARAFVKHMTSCHDLPKDQYNELVKKVFKDVREKRQKKQDPPTKITSDNQPPKRKLASEVRIPSKVVVRSYTPPPRDSHPPPSRK